MGNSNKKGFNQYQTALLTAPTSSLWKGLGTMSKKALPDALASVKVLFSWGGVGTVSCEGRGCVCSDTLAPSLKRSK